MTIITSVAIIIAFVCCAFAFVFAVAVALSSRRPYLVGSVVLAAFVAGIIGGIAHPSRSQPSPVEMIDARVVCEVNTGTRCSIAWRAVPTTIEASALNIEQSAIAPTQ